MSRVLFLFDEDVRRAVPAGLRRREPSADAIWVDDVGLQGCDDDDLLEWAAIHGRLVVTHDVSTMTTALSERLEAGGPSAGVVFVPQAGMGIGEIIDDLLIIWTATQAEEWHGHSVFLPL